MVFLVLICAQILDGGFTFWPEVVKVLGVGLPVFLLGNLGVVVISEAQVVDNQMHIRSIHGIRKVRNLGVLSV
jgi:hypothetical protein